MRQSFRCHILTAGALALTLGAISSLWGAVADFRAVEPPCGLMGELPSRILELREQAVCLQFCRRAISDGPVFFASGILIGIVWWCLAPAVRTYAKILRTQVPVVRQGQAVLRRYLLFTGAAVLFIPTIFTITRIVWNDFSLYQLVLLATPSSTVYSVQSTLFCLCLIDLIGLASNGVRRTYSSILHLSVK